MNLLVNLTNLNHHRVDHRRHRDNLGGLCVREEEAVGQRLPAPPHGRELGRRQPQLPGPHVPPHRRPGQLH